MPAENTVRDDGGITERQELRRGEVVAGKYEILKEIGRGGMSVVYLVMDTHLHKNWALKTVITDAGVPSGEQLRSLMTEAEMLKKLSHPCLPRIVDFVEQDGCFGVVMDYIEGRTLAEILAEEGARPPEKVISWALQLAGVLGYLHGLDPPVIYRDMKPDNIMLKPDGGVVLFDFGIAREYKMTRKGDTRSLGTIGYAAPEQFGGAGQTTPETDIFNLGATIYHLVTGLDPSEPPYGVRPIREVRPELPMGLEEIVCKCTRKNPEERYHSAAELFYALEHYEVLDDAFRRSAVRKMRAFLLPLIAGFLGIAVMLTGFRGRAEARRDRYAEMLTAVSARAASDARDGVFHQEIFESYVNMIDADPARPEGYLGLLEYCGRTGETRAGLLAVCARIDAGAGGINHENEVVMAAAEIYFAGNSGDPAFAPDYARAAKYFSMADAGENPEALYLREIAAAMGTFGVDVDWEKVCLALAQFTIYTDGLTPDFDRVRYYCLTEGVYMANKWAIADTGRDPCAEGAALMDKAIRCVAIMEEESKDRGTAPGSPESGLPAGYSSYGEYQTMLLEKKELCRKAGERMKSEALIRG